MFELKLKVVPSSFRGTRLTKQIEENLCSCQHGNSNNARACGISMGDVRSTGMAA